MRFRQVVLGAVIAVQMMTVGAVAQQTETTVADIVEASKTDGQLMTLIMAAGKSYQTVNFYQQMAHKPELFCPPKDLSITAEQFRQILADHVDRHPHLGELPADGWLYVLLVSLTQVFPCR